MLPHIMWNTPNIIEDAISDKPCQWASCHITLYITNPRKHCTMPTNQCVAHELMQIMVPGEALNRCFNVFPGFNSSFVAIIQCVNEFCVSRRFTGCLKI